MYFPVVRNRSHRLGRFLLYELVQLALWVALVLRQGVYLRSAWGGGALGSGHGPHRPIRPLKPTKTPRPTGLAPTAA